MTCDEGGDRLLVESRHSLSRPSGACSASFSCGRYHGNAMGTHSTIEVCQRLRRLPRSCDEDQVRDIAALLSALALLRPAMGQLNAWSDFVAAERGAVDRRDVRAPRTNPSNLVLGRTDITRVDQ